jgi:hypothetical protein
MEFGRFLYYPTEISSIIVETSRIDPSPLRRPGFLGDILGRSKSLAAKSGADSEESTKSTQTAHSKVGIDAERIRSSIARLTSNSTDELEKLIAELERLQEFLKSETGRVQREIGNVLDGIGIIIEAIAPWKTAGSGSAQNPRANGRDKLKRWP